MTPMAQAMHLGMAPQAQALAQVLPLVALLVALTPMALRSAPFEDVKDVEDVPRLLVIADAPMWHAL